MTNPGGPATGFPEHIALVPDPGTRRTRGARTVLGGSPFRLLRFTDSGAAAVDRVLSGAPVGSMPGSTASDRTVARLLLDAGMAHPSGLVTPALTVAIVVPVFDDVAGVTALFAALGQHPVPGPARLVEIVLVDDASPKTAALDDLVRTGIGSVPVRLLRHDRNQGPGAARNTGWRSTSADLVVFIDSDVDVASGRRDVSDATGDGHGRAVLDLLLPHFSDPAVAAVAPRVRSRPGPTILERYEAVRSPLDLGAEPARVAPRSRVAYVPTAVLAVRRDTLDALGGFDPSMRTGEDVDLVWRAIGAGKTVRYAPEAVVWHRPRSGWRALVRQRTSYGRAAAPLDARHPGQVAPLEANAWSLGAWAAVAFGGPIGIAAGAGAMAWSVSALVPTLRDRVDEPAPEAVRLVVGGTVRLAESLGTAIWRAWLPPALALAWRSTRARRVVVAAAVWPAVASWHRNRPDLDPARWLILSRLDDVAYGAGVWRGAISLRSVRVLAPRLSGIPGLLPVRGARSDRGHEQPIHASAGRRWAGRFRDRKSRV